MANEKVKKVGLLIVTRDKEGKLVAVLQRRGQYNHEKDWGDETFPYGCQLTSAGRAIENEHLDDALWREAKEELGIDIVTRILSRTYSRREISGDDTGEKYTVAVGVPRNTLDLIRWHPSTGGLVFVDAEGVKNIQNLRDFDKVLGVTDSRVIAMFPDEKEVVRQALEMTWD